MNLLCKLQNLPERIRKFILWTIVIIISLALLAYWIKNFQQKLESFEIEDFKEEIELPSLEEEFKNLPKLEMPQVNEKE